MAATLVGAGRGYRVTGRGAGSSTPAREALQGSDRPYGQGFQARLPEGRAGSKRGAEHSPDHDRRRRLRRT